MTKTLFFRMVLRKFSEITNNKLVFSQCNIFYNYKYLFFQSAFWYLLNRHQRSQSNQEQWSLFCSSLCFLVFLCTLYEPLQCFSTYFSKKKKNRSFMPHISRICHFLWLWLLRHFTRFYWKLTKDWTRFAIPGTIFPKIPY